MCPVSKRYVQDKGVRDFVGSLASLQGTVEPLDKGHCIHCREDVLFLRFQNVLAITMEFGTSRSVLYERLLSEIPLYSSISYSQ